MESPFLLGVGTLPGPSSEQAPAVNVVEQVSSLYSAACRSRVSKRLIDASRKGFSLDVLSTQVGHDLGWSLSAECGVAAVVIVRVEPGRVGGCAFGF